MKKIILLINIFISFTAMAQSTFKTRITTGSSVIIYSVIQLSNGDYVGVGEIDSVSNDNALWIVRLNAQGI